MSATVYEMAHSPYCIPITARAARERGEMCDAGNSKLDRRELLRLTGGAYDQVPLLDHEGRFIYESGADTLDVARSVDAQACPRPITSSSPTSPARCCPR